MLAEPEIMACTKHHRQTRRGATAVEIAFVLPVFLIIVFGMLEFGHSFMINNLLTATTKEAARLGSFDGSTTAEVEAAAREVIARAFADNEATIAVKDASVFDDPNVDVAAIDLWGLPDIEVADAEPRQLFVVLIEVPYSDVALFPPFWSDGIVLSSHTVMRHE
jgi:Flp pilus assembly protein TadG